MMNDVGGHPTSNIETQGQNDINTQDGNKLVNLYVSTSHEHTTTTSVTTFDNLGSSTTSECYNGLEKLRKVMQYIYKIIFYP